MVYRIYIKKNSYNQINTKESCDKKNPKAYRGEESIHSQKHLANHALTQTYSIINTTHNIQ